MRIRRVLHACVVVGGIATIAACRAESGETVELTEQFLDMVRAEIAGGGDGSAVRTFVSEQSPAVQLSLADAAAADADPRLHVVAASIYLSLDDVDRAVLLLAELVAKGHDLGGLGFALIHGEDVLALRTFARLGQTLLAQHGDYAAEEQARVDRFLCGLASQEEPCSRDAIEQRLAELERMADELDQ